MIYMSYWSTVEWHVEFYVTEKGESPVEDAIARLSKKQGLRFSGGWIYSRSLG